MQAGAYDTILILFCFSFFPLPGSISMLQTLFFLSPPSCFSFSVSRTATTYGLLVASCSLFFENRSANNL